MSWFNQDRVKFPQQWGGTLAGLFRYHVDVTSWQVTFFPGAERGALGALVVLYIVLQTAVFGSYFALLIAVTITVIVCCVAIALLY